MLFQLREEAVVAPPGEVMEQIVELLLPLCLEADEEENFDTLSVNNTGWKKIKLVSRVTSLIFVGGMMVQVLLLLKVELLL
jgi:hypothetical protein